MFRLSECIALTLDDAQKLVNYLRAELRAKGHDHYVELQRHGVLDVYNDLREFVRELTKAED